MKSFFCIVVSLILMLPNVVFAKEIIMEWNDYFDPYSAGWRNDDAYYSVIETSDGNFVAVGETANPDEASYAVNTHAVIVKYDKDGKIIWKNIYEDYRDGCFYSVIEITGDKYIAVGNNGAVAIYDKGGNFVKSDGEFNHHYDNELKDIIQTDDGGFVLIARGLIFKFTKEYKFEWFNIDYYYGVNGLDYYYNSVIENANGELYVVGERRSYGEDNGGHDGLIIKYDKNGNLIWEKFYEPDDCYFESVIELTDGRILVGGYNSDPGGAGHFTNGVLLTYDKDGNIDLSKSMTNLSIIPISLTNTNDGGYAVGGTKTDIYSDTFNSIIAKYDKNNNLEWEYSYDLKSSDIFRSLIQTSDGGYVVAGYDNYDYYYMYFDRDAGIIAKIYVQYDITLLETKNGSVSKTQEKNTGIITIVPDEKYMIDKIIIKDTKGNLVKYEKISDNEYKVELYDDVTVEVTFVRDYKITLIVGDNGNATVERISPTNARVHAVPNEGYELDEIVIKDSTGKEVVYEEKDGYYYFDVNDDLVITVTFKELPKEVVKNEEEENPKTADAFIYYACAVVCSLFGIWSVEQYRKTRRVS